MEFIKTYFTAEKNERVIFMAFGVFTIGFSVYAQLKWGYSFYKGFSVTAILIGIIQLVAGGTVYFCTDKQITEMQKLYQQDKAAFAKAETPREDTVMGNFSLYKRLRWLLCEWFAAHLPRSC